MPVRLYKQGHKKFYNYPTQAWRIHRVEPGFIFWLSFDSLCENACSPRRIGVKIPTLLTYAQTSLFMAATKKLYTTLQTFFTAFTIANAWPASSPIFL